MPILKYLTQTPYAIKVALKVFGVLLLLQTIGRIIFYCCSQKIMLEKSLLKIFTLGLRYDARMAAVVAVVVLILFIAPVVHTYHKKKWSIFFTSVLTIIVAIMVTVYIVDFYFYNFRKVRLNADILNYFTGGDNSIGGGMVLESYPVFLIIIIFLIVTILCSYIFYKIFYNTPKNVNNTLKIWQRIAAFAFFIIAFNITIVGNFVFAPGSYPLRWSDASSLGQNAGILALNPFQSFISSLKYSNSGFNQKLAIANLPIMQKYFGITIGDTAQHLLNRNVPATNLKPMNVVLVICESFSGYKSSMFGNALNPSPYFKSLCNRGVFFNNCYTPAYGTARGVWATITGIPDVQVPKDATRNPLIVNQHTIINDLTDYEKYYFIGGSTTWANIRGLLKNNIDDIKLYEQEDYASPKLDVWGISDNDLFKEANAKLKTVTKPFFAVIQTANNHQPYSIPKADATEMGLVNISNDSLIQNGFVGNNELNAYRYADFNFKKFMEAAEKETYFNNTLFVFIGDHGIRAIPTPTNKLFSDAYYSQQLTCVHVPLLFYSKGITPSVNSIVASQVDVLPTIASYIGKPYTNTTFGENLFAPSIKNKFAFYIDHDEKKIGIINNDIVYRRGLQQTTLGELKALNNNILPDNTKINYYDSLTTAYFETSRYLIYNNKRN